jgi:hypothetical protein
LTLARSCLPGGTFVEETPSHMETFGGRAHTAAAADDPSLTDICCIQEISGPANLKEPDPKAFVASSSSIHALKRFSHIQDAGPSDVCQ